MSEIMTVESIIEAYWQIQEYFTIPRFSYNLKGNEDVNIKKSEKYSSDIDVLAYNAKTKTLVFAESKAHGEKEEVKIEVINEVTIGKLQKNSIKKTKYQTENDLKTTDDLLKFFNDVKNVLANNFDVIPVSKEEIKNLKIHFISNVYYYYGNKGTEIKEEDEQKKQITNRLEKEIKDFIALHTKLKIKKVEIIIQTHFDVLIEILSNCQKSKRQKRYGNPVLDTLREFNRHLLVSKVSGGNKGPKEFQNLMREKNQKALIDLFQIKNI